LIFDMNKRALLMGWLLIPGWVGATQPASPPQVVVSGTVTTSSGDHPAWLTVMCTQGTGGALSVQLMFGAESASDFPLDAFEGPRAPASFQPSALLKVGTRAFPASAVSGWYSGDKQGAFVFGIASAPRGTATVNRVARALSKTGAALTWIQQSNNVQTPPLVAHFAPDASKISLLRRIAAPCLPR
jgi:hypothetical protein